jgi:hypothetical protein
MDAGKLEPLFGIEHPEPWVFYFIVFRGFIQQINHAIQTAAHPDEAGFSLLLYQFFLRRWEIHRPFLHAEISPLLKQTYRID